MRKFAIPMLIGLLLTIFTFTGCNTPILADEDTWYEFDNITISGQKVTVYAAYSGNGFKSSGRTIEPGLTFIVAAKVGIVQGLDANTYAMQTFKKGDTVVDENSDGANKKIVANATSMDALFIAGRASKSITFRENVTPAPFNGNYTSVENLSKIFNIQNFTWKSLVKELVNSLL